MAFKDVRTFLGQWLPKLLSRKFMAWVVASVALFTYFIDGGSWMAITMVYVAAEAGLDWKGNKTNGTTERNNETPQLSGGPEPTS